MKYDIRIYDNNYSVFDQAELDDGKLIITVNPNYKKSFKSLISAKNIKKAIEEQNDFFSSLGLKEKLIPITFNNDEDIINNIENIRVQDTKEMPNYISNNPKMMNYNIVIQDDLRLNHDDYNRIKSMYGNIPKLLVNLKGNNSIISFQEYENALKQIDKIILPIKKYDLSPLEQITIAYDLVKNRVYHQEAYNEDYTVSRDLSKVLTGDKIVCVGYTELLATIMDEFNIKNDKAFIFDYKSMVGHVRNRAFIKDDKYKVNGMYYFDATFDSNKNHQFISFETQYENFALTENQISDYNDENDESMRTFHIKDEYIEEFNNYLKSKDLSDISDECLKSLQYFENLLYGIDNFKALFTKKIFDIKGMKFPFPLPSMKSYEELFTKIVSICRSKELDDKKLLNLFIKTSKIESLEFPDNYHFNRHTLRLKLMSRKHIKPEERLLVTILGIDDPHKEDNRRINSMISRKKIPLEEQRIELVRVLRKVKESKR